MRRLLLPLALLCPPSMGCDDTLFVGADPGPATDAQGFEGVQAIVASNCLTCHSADSALGDLDLETDLYAATVGVTGAYGVTIVEPGDLDNSMLYLKTTNQQGSDGSEMPVGTGGLSQPENDIIANWILDGAPAQ